MESHASRRRPTTRSRSPEPERTRRRNAQAQCRVGDIVAERETAFCSKEQTLGDACDILIGSGRTAAVVVDHNDQARGVFTENDVITALVAGTERDCSIDRWLRGNRARLPVYMVHSLTVSPEASLIAAAEVMADEKDTGFACHHVLVSDADQRPRLLSALDIARGMLRASNGEDELAAAANMMAWQAMKSRALTASCNLRDKLIEAYGIMLDSRQNSVLVAEEVPDSTDQPVRHIRGIITAADAMRTFSECQDGQSTLVAGWLSGLTSAEHMTAPQRSIDAYASLADAAEVMSRSGIHHLVVLRGARAEVVGTLSALDIVCALASLDDTARAV